MSNSFLSTRKNSVKSVNVLKKLSRLICLLAFFVIANETKGQTTITVGGGASITCPAVPTATWTTPPTGITFSNWSRGSGVTCSSASTALSGSAFQSASASAAVTAG